LSTFVTVGNATQAFDRLLLAVAAITDRLPRPIVVQRGHSRVLNASWINVDFLDMDEFERLLQRSQVVIMHGGAGSIIRALEFGKIPIVMPRRANLGEHVDDHQFEFVSEMERGGYVCVANEPGELAEAIHRAATNSGFRVAGAEPPLVEAVRSQLRDWELLEGKVT
jgi:UDP-N-acetylglucosamine transferase subunit ALG13